jgi:hypothetical protein
VLQIAGPGTAVSGQRCVSSSVSLMAPRLRCGSRRGSCSWAVDAGCKWVVALHLPEDQDFYYRKTPEEALAWCLVWPMASPFASDPISSEATAAPHGTQHGGAEATAVATPRAPNGQGVVRWIVPPTGPLASSVIAQAMTRATMPAPMPTQSGGNQLQSRRLSP